MDRPKPTWRTVAGVALWLAMLLVLSAPFFMEEPVRIHGAHP